MSLHSVKSKLSRAIPLLFVLIIRTASQEFTFPPANGTTGDYHANIGLVVGQNVSITWNLSGNYSLDFYLLQDISNPEEICHLSIGVILKSTLCITIASGVPNSGSWPWIVSALNESYSNTYYLAGVYKDDIDRYQFNSHYINITDPSSASTITPTSTLSPQSSSSLSISTGTTTSTPNSESSSYSGTTTITPASSSKPGNSSSTSTGAIAGGVVGGVLGVCIMANLAFLLFKVKRKDQVMANSQDLSAQVDTGKPEMHITTPEIDGTPLPHELAA